MQIYKTKFMRQSVINKMNLMLVEQLPVFQKSDAFIDTSTTH